MSYLVHYRPFTTPMVTAIIEGRKRQTRRPLSVRNTLIDGYTWGDHWTKWDDLDFTQAWIDNGPSPAGNPGPYYHVPRKDGETTHRIYPRIQVGDFIGVRETWRVGAWTSGPQRSDRYMAVDYKAGDFARRQWLSVPDEVQFLRLRSQSIDHALNAGYDPDIDGEFRWEPGDSPCRWRPSIHMPNWACCRFLPVNRVRGHRLRDIEPPDAIAEGWPADEHPFPAINTEQKALMWFLEEWDRMYAKRGLAGTENPLVWVYDFDEPKEKAA